MLMIPDIKRGDVSIDEKYIEGFDKERSIEALWLIYSFIKENNAEIEGLYSIGALGEFIGDDLSALVIDYQKKDTKTSAFLPSPKKLFLLEKLGFSITELQLVDADKPKNKLTGKDILQFKFSYLKNSELLLGLKLFATACGKFKGAPFGTSDIRIMFENAPKKYSPPIEEILYILPKEQRQAAAIIHNKLEELGCTRNMTEYFHPKTKNKPFATIYTHIGFWFFEDIPDGTGFALKLNLRNIGKYVNYLSDCTDSVRESILKTTDCYGCKKACGGVKFEFENKKYAKCPGYVFRFSDFSQQAINDYLKLIEFEDVELRGNKK